VPGARWFPAYVGIGSNLDTPDAQVQRAVTELADLEYSRVTAVSSLYRSAPLGPSDQPDYSNAVAALLTQLAPHRLLAELRAIEDRHGRDRGAARWGPRTLDLDLLVYADRVIDDAELTLPHAGIRQRNFVLLPLHELAPQLLVPGQGRVAALLQGLPEDSGRIQKTGQLSP
jgi:2-amino-4-hydroxy-6-hydroxymethyldihydropteridine diphosphokinase